MTGWVRLWHDMPTDPKWRSIARKAGQPLPCVIAIFNLIMVNASANSDNRGTLRNWDDEDAASALDIETEAVTAIMQAMQGKVIDGARVTGWEKRQPKREDDGTASRKRAQRERDNASAADESHIVTQCHAPEIDTDTDTETDIVAALPLTRTSSIKKSRAKPKLSIPDGFHFSDETKKYAVKLGFSSFEIDRECQRFIRHAKQNDRKCADWCAAADNWFDKAAEFAGKPIPIDPAVAAEALKGKFYAAAESPQLEAWDQYSISLRGVRMMRDRNNGWLVDSEWPPGYLPPADPKQPSTHHEGRS